MDKVVKKKWLDALRSGKYRQTTGQLKRRDESRHCSYCCLGVLCNVVDPKGWVGEDYGECGFSLPSELKRKLSITQKQEDHLVGLNDNERRDFSYIANYIEETL